MAKINPVVRYQQFSAEYTQLVWNRVDNRGLNILVAVHDHLNPELVRSYMESGLTPNQAANSLK